MHGCSSGGTAWEGLGIMLLRRVCCVCGPIFLRHVVAGTVVVQEPKRDESWDLGG